MKQNQNQQPHRPILITGAARSGTSLTAGIINACGAKGGQLSGPTRHNKRGMFENQLIRNQIVKPFLRDNGWDPMGQDPLPRIDEVKDLAASSGFVARWRERVLSILESQGVEDPWFYKGAKLCLIWPLWHAAFPNANWIIVRRDAEDIISSCLRTSFMRAYKKRSGWLRWLAEHERRFEEMHEAGLGCSEIWPQRMISGDFTEINMVLNSLGLQYDFNKIIAIVDPGLWRTWLQRRPRHGK